jgi:telomerase reverse transcriptase
MAGKRKRTRPGIESDQKRQRISSNPNGKDPVVKQALLAQYYPQVCSLREYLLFKLPATSRIRRKKILNLGRKQSLDNGKDCSAFSDFLDCTLVGVLKCNDASSEERIQQWTSFSQRANTSDSTFANMSGAGNFSQSEVSVYPLASRVGMLSLRRDIR